LFVKTSEPAQAEDIDPDASGIQTQQPENETITYNGKTYKKNENVVNIVFLGIDTTTERDIGNHSDMMIVCAVDAVAKKATLISIPRDTWTDLSKIDTKTGKVEEKTQNRLNAAYLFGGGPSKYGASNAKACIQNFFERNVELKTKLNFTLDIPIPFYASIDIDAIAKIADAVGGVEVTLDSTIPDVGKKGKTVNLKGEKAEIYLRDRHNTPGADIGRSTHQRYFMIQLAKKIKGMGAADAVTKLWDEFNTYGKTDLNLDQALAFAKILNNIDIESIEQFAIPGEVGNVGDASVILHDEAGTLDLLLSVYYTQVQ
jgi:LCP family protein required for cell wall assembly